MKKKLSELTLEELGKREKTVRSILIGGSISMFVLLAVLVYLIFKTQLFVLVAVMPALFVTILPGVIILIRIKAEIKSRNQ